MRSTCLLLMMTFIAGCSVFEEPFDCDTYADRYDPPYNEWSYVNSRYFLRGFRPDVSHYDLYPDIHRPPYLEWPYMNCGDILRGVRPDLSHIDIKPPAGMK